MLRLCVDKIGIDNVMSAIDYPYEPSAPRCISGVYRWPLLTSSASPMATPSACSGSCVRRKKAARALRHRARANVAARRSSIGPPTPQGSSVLYHVSEQPDIVDSRHGRRVLAGRGGLGREHQKIRDYVVPRDCPRVTYYADAQTLPEDSARFLGTSVAVIAIEASSSNRIRTYTLYSYHLPPETFECIDECAGYFVSREPVQPLRVEIIGDPSHRCWREGSSSEFCRRSVRCGTQ